MLAGVAGAQGVPLSGPLPTGYWTVMLHLGQDFFQDDFNQGIDQNDRNTDFLSAYGGEANQGTQPFPGVVYSGLSKTSSGSLEWTAMECNNPSSGHWCEWGEGKNNFVKYWHLYVIVPGSADRDVTFYYRCDDDLRVWNNGTSVISRDGWDDNQVLSQDGILYAGRNSITIKLREGTGGDRMALRVADRSGNPYQDLTYALFPGVHTIEIDPAVMRTKDTATLTGNIVDIAADSLEYYELLMAYGTTPGSETLQSWIDAGATTESLGEAVPGPVNAVIPDLLPGTAYYVKWFILSSGPEEMWGKSGTLAFEMLAPPVPETQPATDVQGHSASLNGRLAEGSEAACGFYFGTDPLALNQFHDAGKIYANGPFSLPIGSLTPGQTYYYKAWASNDWDEVLSGNVMSFTTWGPCVYVSNSGQNVPPYETWATAATDIHEAIEYAATHAIDTVRLAPETFIIYEQVVVTNALSVIGASRGETVVRRSVTGRDSEPKHRIFYVNDPDARVESLTARYGHTTQHSAPVGAGNMGGGFLLLAGTVADCAALDCVWNEDYPSGVGFYVSGSSAVASNCWAAGATGQARPAGLGFYIANGARVTHSTATNNRSSGFGPGVGAGARLVNGGTLRWSHIYDNHGQMNGVGVAIGDHTDNLVEYCIIANHTTLVNNEMFGQSGAGVLMEGAGTLRNCLIANNTTGGGNQGGGIHLTGGGLSIVENCTVVQNKSNGNGHGGIYCAAGNAGRVVNTIMYGNTHSGGASDWVNHAGANTEVLYSCAPGLTDGVDGNITGLPVFEDPAAGNWRLVEGARGVNEGTNLLWMTSAVDLDGNPRIAMLQADMGAYELAIPMTCAFTMSSAAGPGVTLGLPPFAVTFNGNVLGLEDTSGCAFEWDFLGDGNFVAGLATDAHTYTTTGTYYPVMRVIVPNEPEPLYRTSMQPVIITSLTMYVSPAGSATIPYDSLLKAASSVYDAAAVAVDGTTIHVAPGEYTLPDQQVLVARAVTIRALDPGNRPVIRRRVQGNVEPKHRIFKLTHADAVLENLVIRYGHTDNTSYGEQNLGGGVALFAGTVMNCAIENASTHGVGNGGGIWAAGASAFVTNCVISGTTGQQQPNGIGLYLASGARATDCLITNNFMNGFGPGCGAAYVDNGGILSRSTIVGNRGGQMHGAGVGIGNHADNLVEYCVITHNSISSAFSHDGGGVYMRGAGTLRNCLITDNEASRYGGGIYMEGAGGNVESCTVAGNHARDDERDGGGIYCTTGNEGGVNPSIPPSEGIIVNTIVFGNTHTSSRVPNDLSAAPLTLVSNSCAPELTGGTDGNLSQDPLFADPSTQDYRLTKKSPCIGAGLALPWMPGALDLDGFTRLFGRPEMGAYEWPLAFGTVILIK